MDKWIAILVALICLSPNFCRGRWVQLENQEDETDPDAHFEGPDRKDPNFGAYDSDDSDEDFPWNDHPIPSKEGNEHNLPSIIGYQSWENAEDKTDTSIILDKYYYGFRSTKPTYKNRNIVQVVNNHRWVPNEYNFQTGSFGHNYPNWESHEHHSVSGVGSQPGQHSGSHGRHSDSGAGSQPGQHSGSHGHHSDSGAGFQPGQHSGSHGRHSDSEAFSKPGQNWGSHRHHSDIKPLYKPGENWGSDGHHSVPFSKPGQNWGSNGHHSDSVPFSKPGQNWGSNGHHSDSVPFSKPGQNWGSNGHHSDSVPFFKPGQNWGSNGHHSDSVPFSKPGENWGSNGHHSDSVPFSKPGENWGSNGHHSNIGLVSQPGKHSESHGQHSDIGPGSIVLSGQNPGSSRGLPENNQNPGRSTTDGDRIVFPDFTNPVPTTSSPPQVTRTPPATGTFTTVPPATLATPRRTTLQPSTSRPTTSRPTTSQPTTSSSISTTLSTEPDQILLNLVYCFRACPKTPEYNPVCGTNNETYRNPSVLQCARNCGVDVSVARQAPCPRTIQFTTVSPITNPSPTTADNWPQLSTVNPTRYTDIDVNPTNSNIDVNSGNTATTLIPQDFLESIFGSATTGSRTREPILQDFLQSVFETSTQEPDFQIDPRRKLTIEKSNG